MSSNKKTIIATKEKEIIIDINDQLHMTKA